MTKPTTFLRDYPSFDARALVQEHGSPLFLFFPEVLHRNIRGFQEALDRHYPNNVLAYSVKTNYLPFAVRKILDFGVVAEIISGLELDLLEKLQGLDSNTIVNGPLKTEAELRRILPYRCRLNVDNFTELEVLERLGKESNRVIDIGLRVSAAIGHHWLRFGFRVEDGEVEEVAARVRRDMPHLRIVGLHIHGGSNVTDLAYYAAASRLLVRLAGQLTERGLLELKYLDLGGGYATDSPFKDKTEWVVPTIEEYVTALAIPLAEAFAANRPTLIVEPGRYLIDNAFLLLTTVERLRGLQQTEAVLDAGIDVFPSGKFRRHRYVNLTPRSEVKKEYALFGPLCMPSDCLGDKVLLPELRPGDVLCADYAGAYSISQCWNFIRLSPGVVAIEKGTAYSVRRRQTIDHFLSRDVRY